ncbi:MAG: hypothetical protein GC206_06145 [Alphaproteobacteria bacterium]|nr:hypothetical protein [Alphaproteobacteria bacterium]
MKTPLVLSALLALAAAAFAAEMGVARPGGVYRTAMAAQADQCEQLCAGDGLCMAWTYEAPTQTCELKAVVPAPAPSPSAVSGVMGRAGTFAVAAAPHSPPPAPPPPAPNESVIAPAVARSAVTDADDDLLGGDEDLGLRTRFAGES